MKSKPLLLVPIQLLILFSLVSASGTWPMLKGDVGRTSYSNLTGDIGADFNEALVYNAPNNLFASPAVDDLNGDGRLEIVVAAEKGQNANQVTVSAVTRFGVELWDFVTDATVQSSPAIADLDGDGDKDVVFGTNNPKVYALDGKTGDEIWEFNAMVGAFRSSPVVYDLDGDGSNEVFIGSQRGKLYCIDGKSGAAEWTYEADGAISASPAIGNLDSDEGMEVVFATESGMMYAVNGDGTPSWMLNVTGPVVYSTPTVIPGEGPQTVMATTIGGRLAFVMGGQVMKKVDKGIPITGSPAVAVSGNRTVIVFGTALEGDSPGAYTKDQRNRIYGMDLDGNLLWNKTTDGWPVLSSPVIADTDGDGDLEAVVGTREGKLRVMDAATGREELSSFGGTGLYATPAIADVDSDGYLEIVVAYRFSNQVKLIDGPDKPDLMVDSIAFSNDFPAEREKITIAMSVRNVGKKNAGNSTLAIYTRTPVLDHLIGNLSIGPLAPGEAANASLEWPVALPQGEAGIYVKADVHNAVIEASEANNGAYRRFGNDLSIVSKELPDLNGFVGNKTVSASVTVKNTGRVGLTGVEVGVFVEKGGNRTKLGTSKADIAMGGTQKFDLSFDYVSAAVPQKLVVEADPGNRIAEVREDNNAVEVDVLPPAVAAGGAEEEATPAEGMNPVTLLLIAVVAVTVALVLRQVIKRRRAKKKKLEEEMMGKRLGTIGEATLADKAPPKQVAESRPSWSIEQAKEGAAETPPSVAEEVKPIVTGEATPSAAEIKPSAAGKAKPKAAKKPKKSAAESRPAEAGPGDSEDPLAYKGGGDKPVE